MNVQSLERILSSGSHPFDFGSGNFYDGYTLLESQYFPVNPNATLRLSHYQMRLISGSVGRYDRNLDLAGRILARFEDESEFENEFGNEFEKEDDAGALEEPFEAVDAQSEEAVKLEEGVGGSATSLVSAAAMGILEAVGVVQPEGGSSAGKDGGKTSEASAPDVAETTSTTTSTTTKGAAGLKAAEASAVVTREADELFDEHVNSMCLSTLIGFLLEVPALVLAAVFLDLRSCGRKLTTNVCCISGGVCCALVFVLAQVPTVGLLPLQVIATIGRLLYAGAFLVLYIYTSEICPTSLRSSLVGLCSMFARLSGMLSPVLVQFLESLFQGASFLNFFFVTCGSFIASCLYLPETLGWSLQPDIKTLTESYLRGNMGVSFCDAPIEPSSVGVEMGPTLAAEELAARDSSPAKPATLGHGVEEAADGGAPSSPQLSPEFDARFILKEKKRGQRASRYSKLDDEAGVSSSDTDHEE